MPIITKPNPVVKGSNNIFTLSKADLLLNEQVAADVYYSDSDNWNIVKLNYISSSGNQFKEVIFDATQLSPEGIFYASSKSLDVFKIVNLKIYDFDGGSLTVESRSLTVSEFDIDMSVVPGPTPLTYEYNALLTNRVPDVNPSAASFLSDQSRAVDSTSVGSIVAGVATFDVTWELANIVSSGGTNFIVGFSLRPDGFHQGSEFFGLRCFDTVFQINVWGGIQNSFGSGIPTTAAAKIRLLMEGNNQLKVYLNDVLIRTETIPNYLGDNTLYPGLQNVNGADFDLVTSYTA